MSATTVFVDAENVRRSTWPNVTRSELVDLVCAWAAKQRVRAVIVFDGPAPDAGFGEHALAEHCTVVGTERESADSWIARATGGAGPFWLVTSDRGLRARAGEGAERIIGGGRFLDELRDTPDQLAAVRRLLCYGLQSSLEAKPLLALRLCTRRLCDLWSTNPSRWR
jgi:predicted RNA-binding protein with PIN domain